MAVQPTLKIEFDAEVLRKLMSAAWEAGWDAYREYIQDPYVWPSAKIEENPYR